MAVTARNGLLAAGIIAAICIGTCVWMVVGFGALTPFGYERREGFLIGRWDADGLYLYAAFLACVALMVVIGLGIWTARRVRSLRRRASTIVALLGVGFFAPPAAGVHLLLTWLSSGHYTAVAGDTLGRDLVVRECCIGIGEVFEREGSVLELIGYTGADDLLRPFSSGDYTVDTDGDVVILRWSFTGSDTADVELRIKQSRSDSPDGLYRYEVRS